MSIEFDRDGVAILQRSPGSFSEATYSWWFVGGAILVLIVVFALFAQLFIHRSERQG